ncbi:MAG: hypothetical protein FWE37_01285 [Spirochaetaceae bacterium]|nr:hypothetical protein [Spirochaetaceae bacterium]
MEQQATLNNFKTLMLLCANMGERRKLLKDFIIAYHPDRFAGQLAGYYTQLILEATDIFNRTPLTFGAGLPKKKTKAQPVVHKFNHDIYDFLCRLEVYTWYQQAVIYQHNVLYKERALFKAMLACNAFFAQFKSSSYLNEVASLREQIISLAG